MTELWTSVVGANFYEVSTEGRVRSVDRVVATSHGQQSRRRGKVLRGTVASNGYPMVTIAYDDGTRRYRTVHTLVAEAFIGPRPTGAQVCHQDGDPLNARVTNLRYDTPAGNYSDAVAHGTQPATAPQDKCRRGHPLVGENLYISRRSSGREIRQCRR